MLAQALELAKEVLPRGRIVIVCIIGGIEWILGLLLVFAWASGDDYIGPIK